MTGVQTCALPIWEALQKLNDKLQTSLTQAEGVPTVTISALKKEGLDKLMSAVFKVYDRWNVRIPTAPLNKWFEDIKDIARRRLARTNAGLSCVISLRLKPGRRHFICSPAIPKACRTLICVI